MSSSRSYIWNFIGRFGTQLITLITNLVLARLLTPSDFGIIGVLSLVLMVASTLVDSGLGGALMMEPCINKKNTGTIFVFNASISILIYIGCFLSAPLLERFYDIEGLAKVCRSISLVFIIQAFGIVPQNILIYNLNFKKLTIVTMTSAIVASAVAIVLSLLKFGVYSLVAFQLVNALLTTLFSMFVCGYGLSFQFDFTTFKRLFNFGFFTTLSNVFDTIYENLIFSIFGKVQSVAKAGLLSQAKRTEEASSRAVLQTINTTAFPILAKLKDDKLSFAKEAEVFQCKIPLLLTPLFIVLGVYSKEIVTLLFGKDWVGAAPYLSILAVAAFFMMHESLVRTFIKSLGMAKQLFVVTIIKRSIGCIILIACALLIKNYILYGYILGTIIALVCNEWVYAKAIQVGLLGLLFKSLNGLKVLIPLLATILFPYMLIKSTWISIIVSVIILIVYYFYILPKNDVNVASIIKGFLKG